MTAAHQAPPLTYRQREVVSLVALGLTNRAIAGRLALTEDGVKDAVRRVLANLGVRSRAAAAAAAASRGLLLPADHLPTRPVIHVRHIPAHRVPLGELRDVVDRWQGRAPAALLEELRRLAGRPA